MKLFEGSGGYGDGEQRRDFVSVEDVVRVNLHFLEHPETSGIFNVGTGAAQSFNDVAVATVNACRAAEGEAPLALAELQAAGRHPLHSLSRRISQGRYQSYTQADISALRGAGYAAPFPARSRRACGATANNCCRAGRMKKLEDFVGNTPLVRAEAHRRGKTSNVLLAKLEGNNPAGLGQGPARRSR